MKNYKRAKRRQDLAKKVKQRIKKNNGEFYHWMKYTSTICSCSMCAYYKYRKERKKNKTQALKEAYKEIEENEEEI